MRRAHEAERRADWMFMEESGRLGQAQASSPRLIANPSESFVEGSTETSFSPFSSRIDTRDSTSSVTSGYNQSPHKRPTVSIGLTSIDDPSSQSTPISAGSPVSDLEMRIDTERTMDLFTMMPKVCLPCITPHLDL